MKALAGFCIAAFLGIIALWLRQPTVPDTPPILLAGLNNIGSITVLGTSLSAPRYGWPDILAETLSSCQNSPVKMSRVAQAGATSTWGLTAVPDVLGTDPDVVLIELAINDADIIDGLSLASSLATHAKIIETLQAQRPEAQLVLMTTSPVSGLQWIKRYRLGEYFRIYDSLATTYGTGLIHMAPLWEGRSLPDGLHPRDRDATQVMVPALSHLLTNGRCS